MMNIFLLYQDTFLPIESGDCDILNILCAPDYLIAAKFC